LEAAEDAFNVTLYSYAYSSQHGSHACTSSTLNEIGTPKLTSLLSSVQEKPVVETVDFDSLSESVLSAAKTTSPTKVSHLVLSLAKTLLREDLKDVMDQLYVHLTSRPILKSFVSNSALAIRNLEQAGKGCDLLDRFVRCITVKCPDSEVSLMPLDRMPFGLIEYQIRFFTASHVSRVTRGHLKGATFNIRHI
jgi:hypothetical protein